MPKREKIDKEKARYQERPSQTGQQCAACVMFLPEKGKCTMVRGKINRDGWCRYWEAPK